MNDFIMLADGTFGEPDDIEGVDLGWWNKDKHHRGGNPKNAGEFSKFAGNPAPQLPQPHLPFEHAVAQGVQDLAAVTPRPSFTPDTHVAPSGEPINFAKSAGGSNGAWFGITPSGSKFVVKDYRGDQDRIATEKLANRIYNLLGANVPTAHVVHSESPDFRAIKDVDVKEPPLPKLDKGERMSAGMVVHEPDGRVWVYEPKNHFGGYEHTFPKGGLKSGLSTQQNAHREVFEETGLHAQITGYIGDFKGSTSTTRYYSAVRTGGKPTIGKETEAVKLVTPDQARDMLNVQRDQEVLAEALKHPVPKDIAPHETPQNLAVASEMHDTAKERKLTAPSKQLGRHFMTDALVANWDVLGLTDDNVLWEPNGQGGEKPLRIDQGGTFQFRAQGGSKPYGPVPVEVWSMLGTNKHGKPTQAQRGMVVTDADKRAQAKEIADTLTPDVIDKEIDAAPFRDEAMREQVREALKGRVEWMRKFSEGKVDIPRPPQGDAANEALMAQKTFKTFPEEIDALRTLDEHSDTFNQYLRNAGAAHPAMQGVVDTVDALLKEAHTPETVIAHRGFMAGDTDPKALVGKVLTDKGFSYLSTQPGAAENAVPMTVVVPKGTHAVYLHALDGSFKPNEVLMRRGARYRVIAVGEKDGKPVIEAEVVP